MSDHILATSGPAATPAIRVAVDVQGTALSRAITPTWVELTAHASAHQDPVRIKVTDLPAAQHATARIRAAATDGVRDQTGIAVFVDLEVMTAPEESVARARMHNHDAITGAPSHPESLRYVGTPPGLAALICDICRAGVADGVTLRPLSVATLQDIINITVPRLGRSGFVIDDARRALITTWLRRYYRAIAPASAHSVNSRTAQIA